MQFLEWSIIGLRAARHVMAHPERQKTVTLFPMVHLGSASFYEMVHADAEDHDTVLVEGVSSPVTRRLTRAYRWAETDRLGLMVQPKFTSDNTQVIHADLPGPDFEALWKAAPYRERALFEAAATLMGVWLRLIGTRENIGRSLCTNDLPDRDDIMVWNQRRAPMLDALISARDTTLCRAVRDVLADRSEATSIAVIYGAGHMRSLARALDEDGFRVVDSRWLTAFEA